MSLLVKAPLALVTLIRAQPNVLDINLIKGFHIFPKGVIFSSVYSTLVVLRRNWEHCLIVQACHCDKREQAAMNHQDYSATTRWPNSSILESNSSSIRVQAHFESIQFSSKGQDAKTALYLFLSDFSTAQRQENCPKFDLFSWVRYVFCRIWLIVFSRVFVMTTVHENVNGD